MNKLTRFIFSLLILITVSTNAIALNRVQLSAEYFPNPIASKALSNANIYVGIPDTDPEVVANRKTVSALQENGSIVAITQPVKTGLGGIPVYNGSPVTLLVDGQYSVKVTSSTGTQLYYVPVNYQSDDSPVVKYVSGIASLRTTQSEAGAGETIYIVCHTTNGDGGHGTFYWDATSTAADDNGVTIAVTGVATGRWVRQLNGFVTPEMFGARRDGITDDYAAVQSACNAHKRVRLSNGEYLINGPYTSTSGMEMQDGQVIEGESTDATLVQGTIRYMLTAGRGDGGTTDPANNKKNIILRNFTLKNKTGTFLERQHLMVLSAVSNVKISRCNFVGFRGDGCYIGSGTSGSAERHNQNISFEDCVFDGVNNENRMGITIIDGDGVSIVRCMFVNCTKSTMPGSIDIEPNNGAVAICKNITVENCTFKACGGNGVFLAICGSVAPGNLKNLKFINNRVLSDCNFNGNLLDFRNDNTTDETSEINYVTVSGNTFDNPGVCNLISIYGIRGFKFVENIIKGTYSSYIGGGYHAAGPNLVDYEIKSNMWHEPKVAALVICNAINGDIGYNTIISPALAFGISFGREGRPTVSKRTSIHNNMFLKNASPMTLTVSKGASHTFLEPDSNSYYLNSSDVVLGNEFTFSSAKFAYEQLSLRGSLTTALSILPDSLPLGQSWNIINGDTSAPDASKQGILCSSKLSLATAYRRYIVQHYYPANNTTTALRDIYFRKGDAASNAWSAWVKITGI